MNLLVRMCQLKTHAQIHLLLRLLKLLGHWEVRLKRLLLNGWIQTSIPGHEVLDDDEIVAEMQNSRDSSAEESSQEIEENQRVQRQCSI